MFMVETRLGRSHEIHYDFNIYLDWTVHLKDMCEVSVGNLTAIYTPVNEYSISIEIGGASG